MRKHDLKRNIRVANALKVLIVDDDLKLLEIIKDGLAQAGGFMVQTATCGLDAGLKIADFQPDAIVLDVLLEDVPGAAIVQRIRASQVGAATRIVAISGRCKDSDVQEILDAGANTYLKKPFSSAALVKAIRAKRTVHR